MPTWVTTFVVVTLTLLFAYTVVVIGEEGYPFSVIIGGLLGGYAGVDQLAKRKRGDDDTGSDKGGDGA